jgi:hypothetical protein
MGESHRSHRLKEENNGLLDQVCRCRVDCPGSFTTETKELMKHVELHAKEAHPDLDLQPQQVEALVKISH